MDSLNLQSSPNSAVHNTLLGELASLSSQPFCERFITSATPNARVSGKKDGLLQVNIRTNKTIKKN